MPEGLPRSITNHLRNLEDRVDASASAQRKAILYGAIAGVVGSTALSLWALSKYRRAVPPCNDPAPAPLDPLLRLSATQQSALLRAGEITSQHLVSLCIAHIQRVNPHFNAMVLDRFATARAEAVEADERLRAACAAGPAAVAELPWLVGVPCMIKEAFEVAGFPNTSGHPGRKTCISEKDGLPVQRLRSAGAIVLGVTNTSEMCMWMESSNYVYGLTHNAYDTRCIVGGSSGGEACAVSAHFTAFGLGADVGGSIRMPSYFNGIFGHKSSTRLVPNKGQYPGVADFGNFILSTGPLCSHAEDLYPLLCTLARGGFADDPEKFPPCRFPLDPSLVSVGSMGPAVIPDTSREVSSEFVGVDATGKGDQEPPAATMESSAQSSLGPQAIRKVYCLENLALYPMINSSKAQCDAVQKVANAFSEAGCEVIHVDLRDWTKCPPGWAVLRRGIELWSAMMATEPKQFNDFMGEGYPEGKFPVWRELWRWLSGSAKHTLPAILLCVIELAQNKFESVERRTALVAQAAQLKEDIEKVLGDDAILVCPSYPDEVPYHHAPCLLPVRWGYTATFNALQLPGTSCPVWLDTAQRTPLGVTCYGKWGNDHLTLAAGMFLEKAVGGHKAPSWAL